MVVLSFSYLWEALGAGSSVSMVDVTHTCFQTPASKQACQVGDDVIRKEFTPQSD